MLIALDYDNTYTLDPMFWDSFIVVTKARGHDIVVATMRSHLEGAAVEYDLKDKVDDIIFTNRKAKRPFLKSLGVYPDVWIDDIPEFISTDAVTT